MDCKDKIIKKEILYWLRSCLIKKINNDVEGINS